MTHLNHITIGISAFNEEANIAQLLHSLFGQKRDTFVLDKIVVVCDGSTDNTSRIVQDLAKQYLQLTCIDDLVRRGVTNRTQQIMDLNTSDILILFDGDTMPKNADTLENLVRVFDDDSVKLATAALIPIKPTTRFEHMLFSWRSIWTTLTHDWKKGNNIYNFRGVGIAMRKAFAKSIHLPKDITGASSHFLYLTAKRNSLKTAFCKTAVIHYRLATTFSDYLLQINRGRKDDRILKSMFTEIYDAEYSIPVSVRITNLLKNMASRPIDTIVGIIFHLVIPYLNRLKIQSDHNGIWEPARSTKALAQEPSISKI